MREFRRIVTGHDANGTAIVESDQIATHVLERPNRPGVRLTNFWMSDGGPAEYDGPTETCLGEITLPPPPQGSVFRCVEFLPESQNDIIDLGEKYAMGAGAEMPENARHPFMHRTDSLDYAVVLSGEITMLLDDETGDRVLRPGDVVIQRGTNHAWANRGDEPCVMMFVMLDGVTQRDAPLGEQTGIPRR